MNPLIVIPLVFVAISVVIVALMMGARSVFLKRMVQKADALVVVSRRAVVAKTMLAVVLVPGAAYVITGTMMFALVSFPICVMFFPRHFVRTERVKRLRQVEEQLPDALLMMAGALRAGASFPSALSGVAEDLPPPISQEFELLIRELRVGVDLDEALENMERRLPIPDLMLVTAAVTISREVGGNLAEALECAARTLRAKHQMEGKVRALTSQGKMQGIVMTCLPLLLMVLLRFMEPAAMAPLFYSPMGWGTLAVIAVMEVLGYFSIRKITNIDV
ncbi:secretion system protein F [Burkholderia metallica]|uniref:type II secretion system F family protein n=1 Tax=Burkholderia metallica TaxID=488729 RepID=UPI00157AC68D|nr:type II secretion system F family protein [Burkholderia metallica]NTZ88886.1 secretion system protein F [Burkholderia metallica]